MVIGIVTSLHPGDIAVDGVVVLGFVWLGYLGCRLIGLWIDSMRRHNKTAVDPIERLAESLHDAPAEDPGHYPPGTPAVLPDATLYPVQTGALLGAAEAPGPRHMAPDAERTTVLKRVDSTEAFAAVDAVTGVGDGR